MNFSYWEQHSILRHADFMIIGQGLTGLQTAIELKERNSKARVVVCDRFAWSLGASTRNAGFACFANVSEILDDLVSHTEQEVFTLAADRYKGLVKLRESLGDKTIGYVEKGSVEVFNKGNKPDLEKGLDALQMINTLLYDSTGLDRVFHFSNTTTLSNMVGSFHNKFEGQLDTGKLYLSLLKKARDLEVELYGGLNFVSWSNENEIEVHFKECNWSCSNLFICTNAFASEHSEEDVTPARGQVVITEVLDVLPCEGLHLFNKGYYYWRDVDGRILLGGARNLDSDTENSLEFDNNQMIINELKRFMFDQICDKEVSIEHTWSGIMGMGKSNTKSPIVKKVENGVFMAVRLGGMGVALSSLLAEKLVNLSEEV